MPPRVLAPGRVVSEHCRRVMVALPSFGRDLFKPLLSPRLVHIFNALVSGYLRFVAEKRPNPIRYGDPQSGE